MTGPAPADTAEADWQHLHPRTLAVTVLTVAGVAVGISIPIAIGFVGSPRLGTVVLIELAGIVLVTGLAALVERLRLRHTHFRIGAERVELRHSWVLHRTRSVPRDRVRVVDLTADPVTRLFGLARVRIGTGEQADHAGRVALDAIGREQAERLRRELLASARPDQPAGSSGPEIAQLDWGWIRYAPVSVLTPALGAVAFGAVMQVAGWFEANGLVFSFVADLFGGLSVLGSVLVLLAAGLVVGVLGSLGLFVEMWYRYVLRREGENLLMTRGLLNTRSLTMQRRRLRGVEVIEPLGARTMGAGRVDVIATGMGQQNDSERADPRTILPVAPFAVARRVAADVLGSDAATATAVSAHPRAALARRVRWALYLALVAPVVLAVLGWSLSVGLLWHLAWIALLLGALVGLVLARESYRNLGHGLAPQHLVTRYGVGARRTAALLRTGVIGWNVSSSPFQRRAGLSTLRVTTAANDGAYPVHDVGVDEGLRFAATAVPGLLEPFLESAESEPVPAKPVRL